MIKYKISDVYWDSDKEAPLSREDQLRFMADAKKRLLEYQEKHFEDPEFLKHISTKP